MKGNMRITSLRRVDIAIELADEYLEGERSDIARIYSAVRLTVSH
jgi:hypothetical protein